MWWLSDLGLTGCTGTSGWKKTFRGRLLALSLRPTGCGATFCSWALLIYFSITVASPRFVTPRRAFCSRGGFCLSVCWRACAMSRFESNRVVASPAGNWGSVCFDSDKIHPRSSLDPRARSRTKIVKSALSGNSFDSIWKFGSSSEIEVDEVSISSPILLWWQPICTSAGDWALCPLTVRKRKEKRMSGSHVLSFSSSVRSLACNCSVMVRIHLSFFHVPYCPPPGSQYSQKTGHGKTDWTDWKETTTLRLFDFAWEHRRSYGIK